MQLTLIFDSYVLYYFITNATLQHFPHFFKENISLPEMA